jgi:hypothetical protein
MKKVKLTIEQAQHAMFELLKKADLGDRVYEFAQGIFQGFINFLETGAEIKDKERLDSGEEWYDGIQEEFYQAVYDKLTEFLTQK